MRPLIFVVAFVFSFTLSFAQKIKVPAKKYPSLLWEITGKGLKKPSYLFGTMHVSSKMVFHLSDSFYIGLKNADVVALETDMGSWQEDFSRYDMEGESMYGLFQNYRNGYGGPEDYLSINTLKYPSYEKIIEMALYSSPSMINNFLYRNNSERAADFEEDTYLDMHIYQAGKKWGKKVVGVEDFDQSMKLMKEAYEDAAREKNKKEKSFDFDEDLSYAKLEDAYRTGNLDWLDSINRINSNSAAFDEKFLYRRNDIQAASIDSILKLKQSLFVGVGAAHLPGERGVIEILRRAGYKLRPIKMTERDSRHKDEVEKIRVPVQFSKQSVDDGFFTVNLPGKLYQFGNPYFPFMQQQFADMSNGSYYIITRINTNSLMWGHSEDVVLRKIDSVMYENIPGKILSKNSIVKNGYKGFEVLNRTRRGDYQRYNIFATPFEIIIFKMSGNGEYVKDGKEGDQFFSSIEFKDRPQGWQKWSPSFGGFEAEFPHEPILSKQMANWQYMAMDKAGKTAYHVIRTDIHNYEFVEEDSFDLGLMEESFASSDFIDKQLSRKQIKYNGYSALDAKYKYKDGSVGLVRFLIQGPHYYTVIAHAKSENPSMNKFLQSFTIRPMKYGQPVVRTDTSLYFKVSSPVPLEKAKKISLYPENIYEIKASMEDDYGLEEQTTYKNKLVSFDSTGEKIYISFSKPYRYYYDGDTSRTNEDTTRFKTSRMDWVFRSRKTYELPNKTKVFEYVMGEPRSSRYVWGKLFSRDGVDYRLETEGDTITAVSPFVSEFFRTFEPSDTVKGTNVKERKTALFFEDFFSKDTSWHKRAVKNISRIDFDSTDLPQLKKAIASLSWKEKKYLDVKKEFIWQLGYLRSNAAADLLRQYYTAAGDTVELQYTALDALLTQRTAYAYRVFKDIMISDPPVIGLDLEESDRVSYRMTASSYNPGYGSSEDFLDHLTDTLQLTSTIMRDLLPLININDYESPMMRILKVMVDSNMVAAADYEAYTSKFLIEARQLMKKQIIQEKSRQIEKAQETEEDKEETGYYGSNNRDVDYGNSELSLYATLLMPLWDKNSAVQPLITQMLNSSDKRLKYNTMMLLLHNKKKLNDTLFNYFAGMDEYRYELYTDLKREKQLQLFPQKYNNHIDLARSELLDGNSYNKPDTLVYINRLPVQHKDRNGYVYFFKYKQKKDDNNWKIASVGLVPQDAKNFTFEFKDDEDVDDYDFTGMADTKIDEETTVGEQIRKLLKRMQYAKRNSAANFYQGEDGNRYGFNMSNINFGD